MDFFSQQFIPTSRQASRDAEAVSHILGFRAGLFFMLSAGIYSYLPLGYKVIRNIEKIIRKHMNASGAQELLMSALQPIDIWRKTGRDEILKDVMLTLKDRKGRELCLGPTHEELITEIAKRYTKSYKQMPFILYQIQTKFRDEARPRFGLLRSCEFIMKDAYSFDVDEAGLDINYQKMYEAYNKIFAECGVEYVSVEADSGAMGGKVSHEFMIPAEIGEDTLFYCAACNKYFADIEACPTCKGKLHKRTMIEVGHIFKLGTKYSAAQEALFLDSSGARKPVVMGCYGIGVSRMLSAIIEGNNDSRGIVWPVSVAPYKVIVSILNDKFKDEAVKFSNALDERGAEVLIDDRPESPGVKFNDAALIGIPYILVFGKTFEQKGKVELEIRRTGQKHEFELDKALNYLLEQCDAKR
ncbi:MAG: proline--tRNA ligase [Candidatus Omnitrophica bacterium]|nr:proline--tRNA ligase [Candidatus Omnitrophota bacterium]